MTAEERFEPLAASEARNAIKEAGGNEVFLVGKVGENGRIEEVTVGARGTEDLVPILRPHLSQGDVVIHNHPSGELTPSGPDIAIASKLGNEGMGFAIVDNAVSRVYVVAEPVAARQIMSIDPEALAIALAPGGAFSRVFPGYEKRESQIGMLRLVSRAFNGDEIAAIEAGTGVGKSLAYLIPALAWARTNGERVVISTNTINLQQQLMEKDIPLAARILVDAPKAVLVKGRGNYLCANRLREALDEVSLFKEENGDLQAILEWSRTTQTGDRSDLSIYPGEETWSKVCSEADTCLGLRCQYREGCFVLKARRDAASALILVANHHLLFSDLSLRMSGSGFDDPAVLPPFRRIVFDEAHNIERAATSFFSRVFSRPGILKYTGRIYRKRKNRVTGHYTLLVKKLGRKAVVKKIPELVTAIQEKAAELDEAAFPLMGEEGNLLLDSEGKTRFSPLSSPMANLSVAITNLVNDLEEVLREAPPSESEPFLWDLKVQATRLAGLAEMADRFRSVGAPDRGHGRSKAGADMDVGAPAGLAGNDILWMESVRGRGSDRFCRFSITPLDVAPLMREAVFEPMKTVVMTSATLTVAGGFEFWAGRIGLSGAEGTRRPIMKIFPSPFNYPENVLLGVPTDAPAPTQPGYKEFLSRFVTAALRASRGSGLVLFTSYALLRDVHAAAQAELAGEGIRILKQGDDDRARLLDAFRADTGSVLFATDSFWEGVDAPGETLRNVILCRLPFRVPSEPVLRARMTAIEERGGNPFAELSLPDAVVRLRQGFGRLMRRHDDRGVVLILDSRIVSKGYGAIFLESLPRTKRAIAGAREVLHAVADFFEE